MGTTGAVVIDRMTTLPFTASVKVESGGQECPRRAGKILALSLQKRVDEDGASPCGDRENVGQA
jgi:hypothetical protein